MQQVENSNIIALGKIVKSVLDLASRIAGGKIRLHTGELSSKLKFGDK